AEAQENGLPEGPVAVTPKGKHFLSLNPGELSGRRTKVGCHQALDVLASGITVVPPSVHRTGKAYRWEISPKAIPLKPAPEWVTELLKKAPELPAISTLPSKLPTVALKTLRVTQRIRRVIEQGRAADPTKYPSDSEAQFAAIRALVRAGYDDATIASVVMD